jgi:hypothetical protein
VSSRVTVEVRVSDAAVREYVTREVSAGVQRLTGRVRDLAKAEITMAGRVDTGRMRNATIAEVVRVEGYRVVGRVVTETDYAGFQHDGTANDGLGTIVPRRARVLRFRPRGSGVYVFTPEVRGVKGVPFLTNALERATAEDFI